MKIPFQERKTVLRGGLDLLTGRYPRFLFRGSVGNLLPVFHFHDEIAESLELHLRYLSDNGYRTVTCDAMERFVLGGVSPGPKSVALCFDDAWAGLATVAAPLLKKYNLTAIAFAIPGRIESGDPQFATWPQLAELESAGLVDVQAHTYSHARIFCSDALAGFVTPGLVIPPLARPLVRAGRRPGFVTPDMLGCPLYECRSRMSDALRYTDDSTPREECLNHVRNHGGAEFFRRPDWEARLREIVGEPTGLYESPDEQRKAILEELVMAREVIRERLGKDAGHLCLPWAVCGAVTESLIEDAGYKTAFADRLFGKRAVVPGNPPYRLMRLKHQYIFCLPGPARATFFSVRAKL